MELLISSVWRYVDSEERIRIISLAEAEGCVVIYSLNDDRKKISKPVVMAVDELTGLIRTLVVVECFFPVPGIMLQEEESLNKELINARDQRYEYIKELVIDPNFAYQYAISNRSRIITEHARSKDFELRAVYRSLRDYWRYGLTKNALIPLRTEQGGPGKERINGDEKRGRPITKSHFGFDHGIGINISQEDKNRIKKGYKKYYASPDEKSLKKAFEDTLNEFYSAETIEAYNLGTKPKHPTLIQFKYWGAKLVNQITVNINRKPKGDFEKNQRGTTKSVMASGALPGEVFEIDSTPADVHIVSPLNRTIVLGKPTIYSIIDRASRMIVGIYICLEHPSWEAARLAILNAFTDKVAYAKRYGIDIKTSDWPCQHVPAALIGDRGELKGKIPCQVIPTTGVSFDIAPVDRPDMKGIVENSFNILNRASLHELPGTTKGRQRKRMEPDPRQSAALTLDELTGILIRDVLKHNNSSTFDDLATDDLIKANLSNTPLNFWNFYVSKHRHFLRKKSLAELKALLLPKIYVKVTKNGICHNDVYYTCDLAEKENWFALARAGKEWKIEGRFDENHLSELIIRPNGRADFIFCHLTRRSERHKNLHFSDLAYMKDWKRFNATSNEGLMTNLNNFKHKEKVVSNAKEAKLADKAKHHTNKSNVVNMRENRRAEALRLKVLNQESPISDKFSQTIETAKSSPPPDNSSTSDLSIFSRLWEDSSDA